MRRFISSALVGFFALALTQAGSVSADQNDPELDELFSKLNLMNPGPDTARRAKFLQNKIWIVWYENESESVKEHMADGVEAMNRGLFKESIAAFTRAIEEDADFSEAWNRRATVYFLDGQLEKSLADVDRVLELEPRHFGALSGAAQIYTMQEKPKQAVKALKRALRVNRHMTDLKKKIKRIELEIQDKAI